MTWLCCDFLDIKTKRLWKNWRPVQKNSTWTRKCYEGIVFLTTAPVNQKEEHWLCTLFWFLINSESLKAQQQVLHKLRGLVVSYIISLYRIYYGGCSPYLCHQQITIPVSWHFMGSTRLERVNGPQMHFYLNTISWDTLKFFVSATKQPWFLWLNPFAGLKLILNQRAENTVWVLWNVQGKRLVIINTFNKYWYSWRNVSISWLS